MKPSMVKETIKALFEQKSNLCIEGPPGIGKTSIVEDAANDLGVPVIFVHMPTTLPEDFGVMFPDTNTDNGAPKVMTYHLPHWYPSEKSDHPDKGILCFDDRNQANADLQKVLANILQARTLHGVPIKKGWMILSTGNRVKDRAGANRILSHLRDREVVITQETSFVDWLEWAMDNDVRPEVISYLNYCRQHLMVDFSKKDANPKDTEIYPTPRSWKQGVSDIIGKVSKEAERECFNGAIGEATASEFVGFVKVYRNLPDLDLFLKNPEKDKLPKEPSALYATVGALAHRVTPENYSALTKTAHLLDPEFASLLMRFAAKKDPKFASTKDFGVWVKENRKALSPSTK